MSSLSTKIGAVGGLLILANVVYSVVVVTAVALGGELDVVDAMSLGGTLVVCLTLAVNSIIKGIGNEED
jgi:hypothetical protein